MLDRRVFLHSTVGVLGLAACGARSPSAGRARTDLYHCEGCEGALERMPATLGASTRIAPPGEPGEPMIIESRVLKIDGRTPAGGVIIYAYHTNAEGKYANGSPETVWSQRHGRLRGWVRTDADGRFRFETIKPAPYPNRDIPAHVHLTVLEPGRRPYYIDDIVFDGEFGVTDRYRAEQELRGGTGIVNLSRRNDGTWVARRDIILERHPD